MDSKSPVISVIIPIYNARNFLEECIASVRACSEELMECILVNDGSTDGSKSICEDIVSQDGRFRLINKKNSGVSESRNLGLQSAKGEYIFFLDADDYVDIEQWDNIFHYACNPIYDLVAFSYYSFFPSGRVKAQRFPIESELSKNQYDIKYAILATPLLNTCWGKLLRRSVIEENRLGFDSSLVTCEDAVFMIDFVTKSQSTLLSNLCVIYYRLHELSAMYLCSIREKLEDFSILWARRCSFLKEQSDVSLWDGAYREAFSVVTNLLLEYAAHHSFRELQSTYDITLSQPVVLEILSSMDSHTVDSAYKKLEYALMRRGNVFTLSCYFRVKSQFIKR